MMRSEMWRELEKMQVEVRDELGRGAFSEVYSCRYDGGLPGAIKISHEPLVAGRRGEAEKELERIMALADLPNGPNLIRLKRKLYPLNHLATIWDLGEQDLGHRLEEHQARGGRQEGLPRDELLRYVREVGQALDFLHGKGIYHRDVKPKNIVLISGAAYLADLGHAVFAGISLVSQSLAGTPAYLAPEAVAGRGYSAASDIFSLAVTYLELRTGRPPFGNIPELLADLGPIERRAVEAALAPEPRRRPRRVLEWVQGLEQAATRSNQHACHACGSTFETQRALAQHRKDKHPPPRLHPCTIGNCGARFRALDELEAHVVDVHHWRLCRRCEKSFLTSERLEEHSRLCEGRPSPAASGAAGGTNGRAPSGAQRRAPAPRPKGKR
jgi:serine/threonine protein kinase